MLSTRRTRTTDTVIWYNTKFTDATVRFAIRAEKVKSFVFTLNDEKGHVFRYVLSPTTLAVRAWREQGPNAKAEVLPVQKGPKLADGVWIPAELKFSGDSCTLKLGSDFTQTFQHPAIGKQKTRLGLGFAFGTLSVRDVSVVAPSSDRLDSTDAPAPAMTAPRNRLHPCSPSSP